MSIEIVKSQIHDFLRSEKPEVLAIKGEWGVGKTYSWNKFLLEAKNEKRIALQRYSYVSLFGINSLDAFKYSIFEHIINHDMIGSEATIDTFKNNTASLLEVMGRKSLGWFKGASLLKNFTPAIESLSFLSLNKSLICIDDLERIGSGLSIKDVLGLVSQLKEQKKCKIVLLLNSEEDGLEDYNKYREKVIDIELKFSPTAEESSNIAYDSGNKVIEGLPELTQKLDIKNIRVLKKIERLVTLVHPLTNEYEPEIFTQVCHSIVMFSWSYYCSGDEIPSLDYVTNIGYGMWGIGDDQEEDGQEKKWRTTISNYEYIQTDGLDLVIADAVKTGYFIENDFKKEASKKNDEIITSKSQGSFSTTWRLYHDSFDDNGEEVMEKLYESFMENAKNITPINLNGTVQLFRELGEGDKASEIIDFYINERKHERELFNMDENNFFGDIRDQEIVDKFNDIYTESVTIETAGEVLERIAGKNGWNQKDEIILANTTEDEYYDLFKTVKGKSLSSYVNTCLKFGQFQGTNEQMNKIANRATNALKRIAGESEINKLRVKKFGIKIDDAE